VKLTERELFIDMFESLQACLSSLMADLAQDSKKKVQVRKLLAWNSRHFVFSSGSQTFEGFACRYDNGWLLSPFPLSISDLKKVEQFAFFKLVNLSPILRCSLADQRRSC